MKNRIFLMLFLLVCTVQAVAQSYVEKHKNGDWYWGLAAGFSQSLAENAVSTDFISHQIPSANVLLGHNFTPVFGMKLTGGLNMQLSRCSKAAETAMPNVYGNGRYSFKCLTATLTGMVNISNMFFGYEDERPLTWSFLFGGGVLKAFDFDKKIQAWNEYPYYPVNGDGGVYALGHVGVQCAARLSEPWDLQVEFRTNVTDNQYNGVSNGNHLDFYLDLMVNFVYHFKNGKQGLRRFRDPKREPFVDPILKDNSASYVETVRMGEAMHTVIPFYSGFYYLNVPTTKRVEVVANFLKKNPSVNLNIIGRPDVTPDEDVEYHRMLAQKRAQVVKNALVEQFGIDEQRLRISHEERALQPYKTVREWVPSVTFVMESPAE